MRSNLSTDFRLRISSRRFRTANLPHCIPMMSTKKPNIKPPANDNQMQDQYAEDRSMLLIEQEALELISCGRLVRDAPGASVQEKKRTDILFTLLSQVESEGSAFISNLDGSNAFNASNAHPTHSTHQCIYASMHPCIRASMYPCIHASMHPCIHESMHRFLHACIHASYS